jgi:hypothetical protein
MSNSPKSTNSTKSLGERLANVAEKHREQQEWRKHRMAWKFPTRKNYENWLASQKANSSNANTNSNVSNTMSTSSDPSGPVFLNKPKTNKCIAGFGGKKYKKVNGKWVSCGGKRSGRTTRKARKSRRLTRRRR